MFKIILKCAAIGAFIVPVLVLADTTIAQPVKQVLYDGNADYAYFIGQAGWTTTNNSCSPYYAQIPASVTQRTKLLSVIMTAYAMGKKVQFSGTCDSNPSYFDVTYVTISD